jgi:hypothetical protein
MHRDVDIYEATLQAAVDSIRGQEYQNHCNGANKRWAMLVSAGMARPSGHLACSPSADPGSQGRAKQSLERLAFYPKEGPAIS